MNKEIIKFLRKSYNMTQRDFAKAVNCSFALIALVEVGKRRITGNLEEKIKSSFNLDDKQISSIANVVEEISKSVPPFM
ncbi:helix-turn-helix domain-containing protein [Ferdinandcohnia quinoae]|uniref:Helix-turn-helix domain-containing protein n=1 Tax=Fredinandcohnia quinoae TaxID=2918902 RepID=A0AAW5E367_9BACI|nr:helix-turn-helix transcriptional regulator [Fredinandcohnia sp. SECRCQ15]MCH1626818.1 helix-turn-helix domain-containing protein [Fredinandcohnia sp. SECRCQ15]